MRSVYDVRVAGAVWLTSDDKDAVDAYVSGLRGAGMTVVVDERQVSDDVEI